MNTRRINLDLTVGLINEGNTFNAIHKLLKNLSSEIGSFLSISVVRVEQIGRQLVNYVYALQYEHCKIDVDVVWNKEEDVQQVKGFRVY